MAAVDSVAEVDAYLRRGEPIGAYDRARHWLDAGETDPRLRYLTVLALARSGATAQAATRYHELRIGRIGDIDSLSLWARIRKDAALSAPPARRAHLLDRAAAADAAVHAATGDHFPGINAATLACLNGRRDEAARRAEALLRSPALAAPATYYAAASRAEALVLLGRWDEAGRTLAAARPLAGADLGAVSTTRRQLALLLDVLDVDADTAEILLGTLRLPRVAHLSGDEIGPGRAGPDTLAAIDAAVAAEEAGFGVGAFWTEGDVVLAERLLAGGGELHLVLPFAPADYLREVARTLSDAEAARRDRCLERAATVTAATADGDHPDPSLVAYAARMAAGLARLRARRLATECVEIALRSAPRDGEPPGRTDGSATRLRTRTIRVATGLPPPRPAMAVPAGMPDREARALLFAYVERFSAIPESRLPGFWSDFMGGLADVIGEAGRHVLYRNTWGDALFLVVDEVEDAAHLALALQERAALLRHGDRRAPALRIGLHHGPVFHGHDPIRGVPSYFGTQVSRAARVEPVAPPGAVYVTEPFAALLAECGTRSVAAEYVGRVPLPKRYGEHRMYRLARRWAPD